jgi:glycosyltransferase involved in cell wall biosynthesis
MDAARGPSRAAVAHPRGRYLASSADVFAASSPTPVKAVHVVLLRAQFAGRGQGGGGGRLMLELARGLRRLGHQVSIVCHDFAPTAELDDALEGIDVRYASCGPLVAPAGRLGALRQYGFDMRRVARLVPPDASVLNPHEWPALRAGSLAARAVEVPLVWTRNDPTIFERAIVPQVTAVKRVGPLGRLARICLAGPDYLYARRAGAIVVLDEQSASVVRQSYRRSARVVRIGPADVFFEPRDTTAARERLGVSLDAFLAVAVGVLYPHRRFEDLIRAVAALPSNTGITAYIVGPAHLAPAYAHELRELIDETGTKDRVVLVTESISEDRLLDTYAAADVLVHPQDGQTYGLAPLEALATGKPVVLSSGAGVHEILEGRPGVTVVPPRRPAAIAQALLAAWDEADEGVASTRHWIHTELTVDRYVREMESLYLACIPEP